MNQAVEERVLVVAPTGRDAALTCEVLANAGLIAEPCVNLAEAWTKIEEGAGALLLTEESLSTSGLEALARALASQPPWSDLPIIVLTGTGKTAEVRVRAVGALEPSGNVTILERPVRVFTMVVTVQAMLRARRRQYQMRDLHARMQAQMENLQTEKELRARFVSLLAHDLRGPLSAAALASELLLRNPERLDQRRDLGIRIKKNLDRIGHMVHDLLDTSRIHAGQPLPLRLDECELTTIARDVIEELNHVHGDRFQLDSRGEIQGVWSAEELRRAVWNLASNAIKYGMPDSTITVTIRRVDRGARLSVHNRGNPISPEDQCRVFEPFARARSAEASSQLGWGLGLTLVRGCVEAHGGRVYLESSAETGTTFTIEIPLDARPFQHSPEERAAPQTAPPGMSSTAPAPP
jgi:signal transduction histidine kinase